MGDLARGLYSSLLRPATSTSLYSFPPISDEVCPSRFSRLYIFPSPFLLRYPRVLFSRRFRLPTTCEGDGAAAPSSLYESRPRRYFAFGVHCYHPILRRFSSKLEKIPSMYNNVILCNILPQYFSSKVKEIFIQVSHLIHHYTYISSFRDPLKIY